MYIGQVDFNIHWSIPVMSIVGIVVGIVLERLAEGRLKNYLVLSAFAPAIFCLTILIHEVGHAVPSVLMGYNSIVNFDLYAANTEVVGRVDLPIRLVIIAAGPLANLLLWFAIRRIKPEGLVEMVVWVFARINLFLFAITFLPLHSSDMVKFFARITSYLTETPYSHGEQVSLIMTPAIFLGGLMIWVLIPKKSE